MPVVWCDINTDVSGVVIFKTFQSSWPKECNGAIYNAIGFMCCWCWCQWHHMTKKVMLHLILVILTWGNQWGHLWCYQHQVLLTMVPMVSTDQKAIFHLISVFWLKKCNSAIDDAVSITWHWYQCHWQHLTKKAMLHLILIVLSYEFNGIIYYSVSIMWW